MNKGQPLPPGARGWDRIVEAPLKVTQTLFRILRLSRQEGGDGSNAHYRAVGNRHRQGAERPGLTLGGVEVDRGVTVLPAFGGYTGRRNNILLCVARNNEINLVRNLVKNLDSNAFFFILNAGDVIGKGFK